VRTNVNRNAEDDDARKIMKKSQNAEFLSIKELLDMAIAKNLSKPEIKVEPKNLDAVIKEIIQGKKVTSEGKI
jgi:hypothetical protein